MRIKEVDRRLLLRTAGTVALAYPMIGLVGCGSSSSGGGADTASSSGSSTGGTATGETGTSTSGTSAGGSTSDTATTSGSGTTSASAWLAGGTTAMTAPFPPASDPLDLALGNVMCTIAGTNSYTVGPCYFDVADFRDDISEGQLGVPMTLVFKLVDANCNPIEGAQIEVWWCDREGIYSGDNSASVTRVSSFNAGFCTGNDAEALAAKWFRGVQTTDSAGNVYFLGCFPGWYRGRTTHIHLRVVVDGAQRLISQFCFDDELSNDIYESHSDYTGVSKDTNNDNDSVFGSEWEDYTMIVEQQFDRSMLAYKAIQIV